MMRMILPESAMMISNSIRTRWRLMMMFKDPSSRLLVRPGRLHVGCQRANPRTMKSYLEELSAAVTKAERLCDMYIHTPLRLKEHVRVDPIGFYEDPEANMVSDKRLYSTALYPDSFNARSSSVLNSIVFTKLRQGAPALRLLAAASPSGTTTTTTFSRSLTPPRPSMCEPSRRNDDRPDHAHQRRRPLGLPGSSGVIGSRTGEVRGAGMVKSRRLKRAWNWHPKE